MEKPASADQYQRPIETTDTARVRKPAAPTPGSPDAATPPYDPGNEGKTTAAQASANADRAPSGTRGRRRRNTPSTDTEIPSTTFPELTLGTTLGTSATSVPTTPGNPAAEKPGADHHNPGLGSTGGRRSRAGPLEGSGKHPHGPTEDDQSRTL